SPSTLCDCVISNLEGGTYDALMALYRRGRRQIGLMNCPHTFLSAQPRIRAMQRFCRDTGMPFSMELVLHGQHNNGESACQALRESWQAGRRFDGLVGANPQAALGAMRFLYETGLHVPQDVSIISYEDNSLCGYATPPLTAVNIRQDAMGAQAAEMMLSRLADPKQPMRSIVVPSYMVERESV
ncbi:MAG: substrate-binding domain-containing protein, partial [Clostridiales bacterium]|nr:substrate-binding domain-containing protein [Clostridiales bacterium]MDY5469785.1 substrate-binding domain-containing protein [Eubacteriales bacterium]